jgi:hypothetical protein
MSTPSEAQYDVNQEGPFWRVRPRHIEAGNVQPSGLLEKGRQDPNTVSGSSRNPNAQSHSDEEIKRLIRTGQTFTKVAADQYSRKHMGKEYTPLANSSSSLVKQGPIGRVFALAATDHPEYKQRVFEAYKRRMPKVVADAKNYDDLLARSYAQLGKETKQQFDSLPVNMSFHRNGEGNYNSSKQMLNDIFNNRHLYVFQGGDPHDFLNEVDPKTGLNTNEMFRAVHDFYGHAVHGNQFGPKGEEEAWAAHGGMFSPLARLAMSSETRGQNSFVNYTPINAKLKAEVAKQEEAAYHARRSGNHEAEAEFLQNKRDLLNHFQYAPQKSVLLPPEMISEKFEGGMPSYLKDLIQPQHGVEAELTHFSHNPNLSMTDPRMYGTGIKGAEASRLEDPSAVKHRTYFYEGQPERGEQGLGVHRYGAKVSNLYPAEADPERLRMLALETNRVPMTAVANAGMTSGSQAYTDMERLAKEYGYKGILSRGVSMPTAAVFEPTKVHKMNKGGEISVTDIKKRKDDKIPQLETAAKALLAGVITRAEYDKTVKKLKPTTQYESIPRPATDEEALGALHENKRQHWRGADELPEGHPVGLRLDIPAYSDHGVWVNSIHDESGAKTPVKYGPVSAVKNAVFDSGASKAQRVATGETNKSPFAKIKGEWQPMTNEEAVAHMQKHLNDPEYAQVGYDPRRRDYFYHRGDTRKPITHAEHVVQIGPLVLAKNPVYGKRKDFGLKDGGVAHMADGGLLNTNEGNEGAAQPQMSFNLNELEDPTSLSDKFEKYGLPFINKGFDTVFPSRVPIRAILQGNVINPIEKTVFDNPWDYLAHANENKSEIKEAMLYLNNSMREKLGMEKLPITQGRLEDINENSFPKLPKYPKHGQPKARGGRVTHAHHLDIEERPL